MRLIITWVASFSTIALLAAIADWYQSDAQTAFLLIGSFGASTVLLLAIPDSRYARPRNAIGGNLISAAVGVTVCQLLPEAFVLSSALSVSLAITSMQLTDTLHPPGGATALIAVVGGDAVRELEYLYLLSPVLIGTLTVFMSARLLKYWNRN